jgi:hypothetical protein
MFEPVLTMFLFGLALHLCQTGIIIGKLVEVSERYFAGENGVVACHVR